MGVSHPRVSRHPRCDLSLGLKLTTVWREERRLQLREVHELMLEQVLEREEGRKDVYRKRICSQVMRTLIEQ